MSEAWQNRIICYKQIPANEYVYVHKDRYEGFMFITYGFRENRYTSDKMDLSQYAALKDKLLSLGLECEHEGNAISMFIKEQPLE